MDPSADATPFEQKWHARWPEWALAMGFLPAAQRTPAAAWFALLQELTDAAFAGADPTPGLAKLAWWQEELTGWSKGARRHPLGATLQPLPVPWMALARALPELQARRLRPGEGMPGDTPLDAFAGAVARIEAGLFSAPEPVADATAALRLALEREHALAHPESAPVAAAAGVMAKGWLTRARAIQVALVDARLRRGGRPVPPLPALLAAWHGARQGLRAS